MPPLTCSGCGGDTNTAVSNAYGEEPYGDATKCYFKYVEGHWVPGCAYDEAPEHMKRVIEKAEGKRWT